MPLILTQGQRKSRGDSWCVEASPREWHSQYEQPEVLICSPTLLCPNYICLLVPLVCGFWSKVEFKHNMMQYAIWVGKLLDWYCHWVLSIWSHPPDLGLSIPCSVTTWVANSPLAPHPPFSWFCAFALFPRMVSPLFGREPTLHPHHVFLYQESLHLPFQVQ